MRNGISFNEFAARVLTCSGYHIKRVFDAPKYWSCYTKNMILHFNAIFHWLNDEQRWIDFGMGRKKDYYNIGSRKQNFEVHDIEQRLALIFGLNDYQRQELEKAFRKNTELNDELLANLSEKLELSFGTISEWFSSRKA